MDKSVLLELSLMDANVILLYVIGALFLYRKLQLKENRFRFFFILLNLMHLGMTLAYFGYTLVDVSDAVGYFRKVTTVYQSWSSTFGQGTYFIYFLLYPIVNFLGISYFGSFFIFSFMGLLGHYYLFKILYKITEGVWSWWYLMLLLPMLHFWTVAIGKDSLIYFGICLFAYYFFIRKNWYYFIMPVLLIGFIRIHILFFVLSGVAFVKLYINKHLKISYKIFIATTIILAMILAFPLLLDRIDFDAESSLMDQLETLQQREMDGGSSVNLSGQNIVVKWFSYVFRPLFFDTGGSPSQLLASFENLAWVATFIAIIKLFKRSVIPKYRELYWFSFYCIFALSIPSAFLLKNLGIAVRQKMMFFPFVMIVLFILLRTNMKTTNINLSQSG